jgi:hypothetical protein
VTVVDVGELTVLPSRRGPPHERQRARKSRAPRPRTSSTRAARRCARNVCLPLPRAAADPRARSLGRSAPRTARRRASSHHDNVAPRRHARCKPYPRDLEWNPACARLIGSETRGAARTHGCRRAAELALLVPPTVVCRRRSFAHTGDAGLLRPAIRVGRTTTGAQGDAHASTVTIAAQGGIAARADPCAAAHLALAAFLITKAAIAVIARLAATRRAEACWAVRIALAAGEAPEIHRRPATVFAVHA